MNQPLPLWRMLLGIGVLAALVLILAALAPIYLDSFRLQQYVNSVAASPAISSTPDEKLRAQVVGRAHQLDLPVQPGDVQVTHPGGHTGLELKYIVQVNFPLYQVDLHFHSGAAAR